MSGVLGGGRPSANSLANVDRGVSWGERVTRRLVEGFSCRRWYSD